jgi:hypothetical protein
MRQIDGIPLMQWYLRKMSMKVVFQDYELLHGQQARLSQLAKPWNSPIQVDGLPKAYRMWLRKAMSLREVDTASPKLRISLDGHADHDQQDDDGEEVVLIGPYFVDYRSRKYLQVCRSSQLCSPQNGSGHAGNASGSDVEDLVPSQTKASRTPKKGSAMAPAAVSEDSWTRYNDVDSSWTIPRQRGVDNSAYTWRRDFQLGRALRRQIGSFHETSLQTNRQSFLWRYLGAVFAGDGQNLGWIGKSVSVLVLSATVVAAVSLATGTKMSSIYY